MMRAVVFLSCVGDAIYALLVVNNRMMPVIRDGNKAEVIARQTRLKVWGPYLPDRSLNQQQPASSAQFAPPRENAAVPFAPETADETVTTSSQIGKRLTSFEAQAPAKDHE